METRDYILIGLKLEYNIDENEGRMLLFFIFYYELFVLSLVSSSCPLNDWFKHRSVFYWVA